jgi:hypothetical protein
MALVVAFHSSQSVNGQVRFISTPHAHRRFAKAMRVNVKDLL